LRDRGRTAPVYTGMTLITTSDIVDAVLVLRHPAAGCHGQPSRALGRRIRPPPFPSIAAP